MFVLLLVVQVFKESWWDHERHSQAMLDYQQIKKQVYLFSEGNANMRDLLGGKGTRIAEMTNAGLPVPPGFTITTETCNAYYEEGKKFPLGLWEEVLAALKIVEQQMGKGFGQKNNPLLVSIRSGAKFSMPGMMDTVLNLGINDEIVQGLVAFTGDERFAYDTYRRFIQMFSKIVLDIDPYNFEHIVDIYKERAHVTTDAEIPAAELKQLVIEFKQVAERQSGEPFPTDVHKQLHKAIEAVFSSWNNRRAIDYRNFSGIPHNLGIAVNVQSMVFGNMGNDSGTGLAFTRNPSTGEKALYGEYLLNAQGEDVVAGIRTPSKISKLQQDLPHVYQQFQEIAQRLERYYHNVQDLEFTIEHGRLWLLQTRPAKRSAYANFRFAMDLLDEGLLSKREAVLRVEPMDLYHLLAPKLPQDLNIHPIALGLNASPGVASGEAAFDSDMVEQYVSLGKKVILIRPELDPAQIRGLVLAQGMITSRGGATSHAAVTSRGLGKPCVAGATIRIDEFGKYFSASDKVVREGDMLTIDGSSGAIYEGMLPFVAVNPQDEPYLRRFGDLLASMNTDDFVEYGIGLLWMLRDALKDRSLPMLSRLTSVFPETSLEKESSKKYISFTQPPESLVRDILHEMQWTKDPDMATIVWGIMSNLGRMLQNEVGIGNHHLAIRPMVDPQRVFVDLGQRELIILEPRATASKSREPRGQLLGLEFFGINHFLRNCLPWGSLQLWITVRLSDLDQNYPWRLDNTNPQGESLVLGEGELAAFLVVLDGRCLSLLETRQFYNELRKREFGWSWYQENNISWREIVDILRDIEDGKSADRKMLSIYQIMGLLTKEGQLSVVGFSLLHKQMASERRHISFAGRDLQDE